MRGIVPAILRLYQDSHWKRSRRERQKFYDVTFFEIWNSKQESTVSRLNIRIEHRKRTNQKRVKNITISDFVETNAMNFVKRTMKQH